MAKAGATHVVVMGRAHRATIKQVVKAGRDYGVAVMGDNLGADDKPACSRMMQDLGVAYIVHHTGYDERRDPTKSLAMRPRDATVLRRSMIGKRWSKP